MREFFKGWRRMVGCVTLVLALAVAAEWGRSYVSRDQVQLPIGGSGFIVRSDYGRLVLLLLDVKVDASWESERYQRSQIHRDFFSDYLSQRIQWQRNICGVLFGAGLFHRGGGNFQAMQLQYWPIVLLLVVFSACLLLWKPRSKPKEQTNA